MARKSKVVAALAIGALLLLVGPGAVRCSLHERSQGEVEGRTSQEQPLEVRGEVEAEAEAESEDDGFRLSFADLENSEWAAEDGEATLTFAGSCIVQNTGEGTSVLYCTLDEESATDAGLSALLLVSEGMSSDQRRVTVLVSAGESGAQRLVCDELGGAYVRSVAAAADVRLAEAYDDLLAIFGCERDDFESVLGEYARTRVPSARTATWDKEVWIDYGSDTMLTNFSFDDAANTVVSVMADASGELSAR